MAHVFYSVENLSQEERFSLFTDALRVSNEFVLDYFDGVKFKSFHLSKEEVIDKFRGLPVTVIVTQRKFPWGEMYGEVGIRYDNGAGVYAGWATLDDEDFDKIRNRLK